MIEERSQAAAAIKAVHARCAIACGGLTGLAPSGGWSTSSTGRWEIPQDDGDLLENVVKPKFAEIADGDGVRCVQREQQAELAERGGW